MPIGLLFAQAKENPFGRGESFFEDDTKFERGPSKWVAAGLSLLVPGAGELYLGDRRGAAIFLSAEGAIWSTAAGFYVHGNWRKEEYRNFAAINAGANPEGKDDEFFEDILHYSSRDSYNYWMHLIYRDEIPLYPETDEYFWEWESDEAWDEYGDIRASSERSFRNAKIVLGVGLINRVISLVHVLRTDIEAFDANEISGEEDYGCGVMPTAFITVSPDGSINPGIGVVKGF